MSMEGEETGIGSRSNAVLEEGDAPEEGELPDEGVDESVPNLPLSSSLSDSQRQIGSSREAPVALLAPVPTCRLLPRTSSPKPPSEEECSSCFTEGTFSFFTVAKGPLLFCADEVIFKAG